LMLVNSPYRNLKLNDVVMNQRKLLFFAAINMVRQNGLMRPFYQRLVGRGMRRIKALVAVARKLLGILFALVRDHQVYIPDYGKKGTVELEAA